MLVTPSVFSGRFLSGFSILSLVLYFVTSSDSGSLVIDCLASNGHPEPPRLQRLLWALLGNNINRAAKRSIGLHIFTFKAILRHYATQVLTPW